MSSWLETDIAVIGSGFGGSVLAMIARRLGKSVVMLEKGRHPRFAIGESSTPLTNLLWEELCSRYDLSSIRSLSKWGSWQQSLPHIACGLKRGFSFFHHEWDREWKGAPDRANELMVGASPHDQIADTHWYRPDFDQFLVNEAQRLGADSLDEVRLTSFRPAASSTELEGNRQGSSVRVRAKFVFDATGPRGFVHRALGLKEVPHPALPPTEGLYTHFGGVKRWADVVPSPARRSMVEQSRSGGNVSASRTLTDPEAGPYPVDDAALHHVFDGGWIWVLRFNNGITSAGVAAVSQVAADLNFAEGAPAWERLLRRLPGVQRQFAEAVPKAPFVHAPRLSFRSSRAVGAGWAMLPSAAGFVDPLLSSGFPLTLLGISRVATAIEEDWGTPRFEGRLSSYEAQTFNELDTAARLVAALYANMHCFPRFVATSLLYFAAASYTETARRLQKPELAGSSFLMASHPEFGARCLACVRAAIDSAPASEAGRLLDQVLAAIEPINVAGLGAVDRRNWYPPLAEDLLANAHKFGVSRNAIADLLERSGFYPEKGVSDSRR